MCITWCYMFRNTLHGHYIQIYMHDYNYFTYHFTLYYMVITYILHDISKKNSPHQARTPPPPRTLAPPPRPCQRACSPQSPGAPARALVPSSPPCGQEWEGGGAQHVLPIKSHVYYMVLHVPEYITWTLHLNLQA